MPERNESEIPDYALRMHQRLTDLGVVGRVRETLLSDRMTRAVDGLTCWVAVDKRSGDIVVRAVYRRYPAPIMPGGASGMPHLKSAIFRVAQGRPFGHLGSRPLPDAAVNAVFGLLS